MSKPVKTLKTKQLQHAPQNSRGSAERIELEAFARNLHHKMQEQSLSQSDLARKIWGEQTNKEGRVSAKNRDRISVWLKGTTIPDPLNLKKLADALGTEPDELAPDIAAAKIDRENPEISMTAIAGHTDKVYLRINKLVPLTVAAEIVKLVAEDV